MSRISELRVFQVIKQNCHNIVFMISAFSVKEHCFRPFLKRYLLRFLNSYRHVSLYIDYLPNSLNFKGNISFFHNIYSSPHPSYYLSLIQALTSSPTDLIYFPTPQTAFVLKKSGYFFPFFST